MATGGASGGSSRAVKAGEAFVEISANDSALQAGLKRVANRLHSWGSTISRVGLGISALGGAVLAPITAAFGEMLSHFKEVRGAALRLGTSSEVASSLAYATGGIEEMEAAARRLQIAIANNDPAFEKLGIRAQELAGLDLDEQFLRVGDALQKLSVEERQLVGRGLFGRGGAGVLGIVASGKLPERLERAGLVGAVVSTEDANKAGKVAKLIKDYWTALKNTWRELAASLLAGADVFETYVNQVLGAIKVVRDWLKENRALVLYVTLGAAGLVGLGTAVTAVGVALKVAAIGLAGFLGALSFLGSAAVAAAPFVAIGVALAGLGYLFVTQTEAGQQMATSLSGYFSELAAAAVESGAAIKNAFLAGRLDLAWKVIVANLELEWVRFTGSFVSMFTEAWHDIVYIVQNLWADLMTWLSKKALDNPVLAKLLDFVGEGSSIFSGDVVGAAGGTGLAGALGIQEDTGAIARRIDREAAQNAVQRTKEFEEGRAAREQERKDRLKAAQDALKAAQDEANAAKKPGKDFADRVIEEAMKGRIPPGGLAFAGSAGAFQSSNFRQLLGTGANIAQKQLDVLEDIRDELKDDGFR